MFNCNQNYHRYNKYYVLIMASKLDIQTNNISISITLGFQNFSENSLSACVKHNKL